MSVFQGWDETVSVLHRSKRAVTAVWDMSTWNRIGHKRLLKKPASIMSISLDGKYLALGSKDGDICVVEVKKMEICHWSKRLHSGSCIESLEFSPSERLLSCLFVVFHPPHRRRYHPSPHQRRTTVATLICVSSNAHHQEGMVEFIGMLKVKVLKGINLVVRDMLSSDPYVVLTLGQQVDENDEELPDFCKFYEKCHKSKKTNDWIDPR